MNDLRALILDAGSAALAVETAKQQVEAVKQQLEEAKAAVDSAKAEYDAALEKCEAAGISKAKARKAVENLNQLFAEIGVIDAEAVSDGQQTSVAKSQRRKKRGSDDASAETSSNPTRQDSGPATAIKVDEGNKEIPAPRDYSEAESEIANLIRGIVDQGEQFGGESAAKILTNALALARTEAEKGGGPELDLEYFRGFLINDFLADPENGNDEEIQAVASWFSEVITEIEEGRDAGPLYPTDVSSASAVDDAEAKTKDDVQEPDTVEGEVGAESPGPDSEEDNSEIDEPAISDDASFPLEGEPLHDGEIVEDITDINFLDEGDDEVTAAEQPKENASRPAETPKPAKGSFVPPAFLR